MVFVKLNRRKTEVFHDFADGFRKQVLTHVERGGINPQYVNNKIIMELLNLLAA